jgi:hypothetical protein
MKTFLSMTSLLMTLMFSACGPRDSQNSFLSSIRLPDVRPLIIGMSGYSTCTKSRDYHDGALGPLGAQLFRQIEPIIELMVDKLDAKPAITASCYTDDRQLISSSSLDNWKLNHPRDSEYLPTLHQQMELFTHVFVVGHSYGGWLSMKLAETYTGAIDKIKTLHTIDPISKELCYFNNVSECLSAPRDIKKDAREHIRDVTQTWANAWQNMTFFLHSSAIEEADQNLKIEAEHWDIDNDESLWETISHQVATSF